MVEKKVVKNTAKKKVVRGKLLLIVKLSTGYEVPIFLYTAKKDVEHLSKAIYGEIFLANFKEHGTSKTMALIHLEIKNIIKNLKSEKSDLLYILLVENFLNETDRIHGELNKRTAMKKPTK